MKRTTIALVSAFLLCSISLSAKLEVVDFSDPSKYGDLLSDYNITAVTQDAFGFIWAASDREVFSFDGHYCHPIETEMNEIIFGNDNHVTSMSRHEDVLLIYTVKGLYLYDIRFGRLTSSSSLSGRHILYALQMPGAGSDSQIISTSEGISRYDVSNDRTTPIYKYKVESRHSFLRTSAQVGVDKDGNLLFMDGAFLICSRYEDDYCKADTLAMLAPDDAIQAGVVVDSRNTVHIFSSRYLLSADLNAVASKLVFKRENHEVTSALAFPGHVCFGFRGQGTCLIKFGERNGRDLIEQVYTSRHIDDQTNSVNVYYRDSHNYIWMGTKKGLFCMRASEDVDLFVNISSDLGNDKSISHNTVNDVLLDGRNNVWIATAGGLDLVTFEHSAASGVSVRHYTVASDDLVSANKMECLASGADGLLWLGTKDKIICLDQASGKFVSKPALNESFGKSYFVRSMHRDSEGTMWIGFASGGIFRCQKDSHTAERVLVKTPSGDNLNSCNKIVSDRSGDIIIGNRTDGVFRLCNNGRGETVHYELRGPRDVEVTCVSSLFVDPFNNLWCGTDNGLFRYNSKTDSFRYVDLPLPKSSCYVSGIISDDWGNLWISTTTGVCRYNIADESSCFIVVNGGQLCRRDFVFGCGKDADGFIYLGGINGLTYFNPSSFDKERPAYQCYFTDFKAGREKLGSEGFREDINYGRKIKLSHSQNHISFSFTELSFQNSGRLQYSYKLSGVDNDWVYAGTKPGTVSYTGLRTGRHTLSIRCSNEVGEWQPQTDVEITVRPPVALSWYLILLYLSAIAALLFDILRRVRAHNRIMTREAVSRSKVEFYKEISHEIRNPYSLLKAPLQRLIDEKDSLTPIETAKLLDIVKSSSDKLALLVDQLVEYAELEDRQDKRNISRIDIVAYVENITEAFREIYEQKGISMASDLKNVQVPLCVDKEKIETVLFELMAYMYRHNESGDELHIDCLVEDGKGINILIESTGQGVSEAVLGSFFDASLGMSLARELVLLHKGSIDVRSDNGMRFDVFLPFLDENATDSMKDSTPSLSLPEYVNAIAVQTSTEQYSKLGAPLVYVVMTDGQMSSYLRDSLSPTYQVKCFPEPDGVAEMALKDAPKLIISGLMFSREFKGFDFCAEIKANPLLNHTPFLFLTSYSQSEMEKRGYEAGAEAYLTKPFDMNYLRVRIERLIKSQENLLTKAKKEAITSLEDVSVMSADEKFLSDAMKVMEKNLSSESFSVATFSDDMNLSPSMLYRRMKALTGMSPNEFIRDIRLKRAAQLLLAEAYTISEIAYMVGFSDIHYFSTSFKKMFNMTPTEYKQSNTKQ